MENEVIRAANIFYSKNKDVKGYRDYNETTSKMGKVLALFKKESKVLIRMDDDLFTHSEFGDEIDEDSFLFSYRNAIFLFHDFVLIGIHNPKENYPLLKCRYEDFDFQIDVKKKLLGKWYRIDLLKNNYSIDFITNSEVEGLNNVYALIQKLKKIQQDLTRAKNDENRKRKEASKQKREKKLESSKSNIILELDKDENGTIDIIESNEFNDLLKHYQKEIIAIDRSYVQQFVKISGLIKQKRDNCQVLFDSIKKSKNITELNKNGGILQNEVHSYNLIVFNALNMIVALVEDDMITFYEIYEGFDKLNIFNSNWEKEVSDKLSNIGDGLDGLMNSIQDMSLSISKEIGALTYVTSQSNQAVSNQLMKINSTLKVNNLLTGIQSYQMYRLNKNVKKINK